MILAALLVHFGLLMSHFSAQGYPFFRSSFDTYQVLSLTLVVVYLLLSHYFPIAILGLLVLPTVLCFFVLSLTYHQAWMITESLLNNTWAFLHLLFVFVSLAIFTMSLLTGLAYLFQEYRLKAKKWGTWMDKLPALEVLDRVHYRALYIGFIFFTVGIVMGGGWSKSVTGYYVTGGVKQMLSLGVWIFLALLINLRVSQGWLGRKGILLAFVGFIGLLGVLLG